MTANALYVFSDELLTYKFRDDHPFNQKRLQITLDLLKKHGAIQDKHIIPPRVATKEELELIHDSRYISAIQAAGNGLLPEEQAANYGIGTEDTPIYIVMSTSYLDEAERCRRVALMHHGRFLAVDTPSQVKALLRTELVEIGVLDAWRAREALARVSEAHEVTVFGQRLHVALPDAARDLPAVVRALEAAGLAPRDARRIVPSLEDVFVSVLRDTPEQKPDSAA